jgi:hypothetical protein
MTVDEDDDFSDSMSRSTTRCGIRRGVMTDLSFNFRLMRSFGNSVGQSAVKAFRMWRGETVYIMPQRSAFSRVQRP